MMTRKYDVNGSCVQDREKRKMFLYKVKVVSRFYVGKTKISKSRRKVLFMLKREAAV
jgi:hypothetical protein